MNPDLNAWLAERRTGIGGSDAAVICGLSPWKSPLALYYEKTGELDDTVEEHEAMRWGQRLESVIADAFAETTGLYVYKTTVENIRHPEHDWMLANIDALVFDGPNSDSPLGVLEVKCTSAFKASQWYDDNGKETVPDHYTLQGQHYLAVTGHERIWFAALLGGNKLVVREQQRDDQLIAQLIELETKFWQRIIDRNPPPADAHDATGRAIKQRFATANPDTTVELDPTVLELIEARTRAKASEVEAKRVVDTIDNQLKVLLGDNETGTVDGRTVVTWRTQTMPERILAATTFRKLNVKQPRA